MRTAFYLNVTAVVGGLLLLWAGLVNLPPTRWLLAGDERSVGWQMGSIALAVFGGALAWWRARQAVSAPLPLPSIPGVAARTSGLLSLFLGMASSLMVFWWLAVGLHRLPFGPVGWVFGLVALLVLSWCAIAAAALWLGRGSEREREADRTVGSPIGLSVD
jgi:hypothetical protein